MEILMRLASGLDISSCRCKTIAARFQIDLPRAEPRAGLKGVETKNPPKRVICD